MVPVIAAPPHLIFAWVKHSFQVARGARFRAVAALPISPVQNHYPLSRHVPYLRALITLSPRFTLRHCVSQSQSRAAPLFQKQHPLEPPTIVSLLRPFSVSLLPSASLFALTHC